MAHSIAKEARVRGRVQGVAFRAWTQAQAEKLGLKGWVRNNDDGSVSALFVGPKAAVDEMTAQLWGGPGAAAVEDVAVHPVEVPGDVPQAFEIRR